MHTHPFTENRHHHMQLFSDTKGKIHHQSSFCNRFRGCEFGYFVSKTTCQSTFVDRHATDGYLLQLQSSADRFLTVCFVGLWLLFTCFSIYREKKNALGTPLVLRILLFFSSSYELSIIYKLWRNIYTPTR